MGRRHRQDLADRRGRVLTGGSLTGTVPHNELFAATKPYGDFDLRLKAKLIGTVAVKIPQCEVPSTNRGIAAR